MCLSVLCAIFFILLYLNVTFRDYLISELCSIFCVNPHLCYFFGSFTLFFLNCRLVFCVKQLKLDEKEINTSDFWKRQIIIASMHKQPASFGIYVPAKDEAVVEGGNIRRVCN